MLDIGTGTGIVPMAACETAPRNLSVVGCDRSARMLLQARAQVAGLSVLEADATALPFRNGSFDLVTASFVLSHVGEFARALAEASRVLKREGKLAVSNWAPPTDPYGPAWNDCLAEAISKPEVDGAVREVVPCEDDFSRPGRLEAVLANAGFAVTVSDSLDLEMDLTIDQFLEDRELSSAGRRGLDLLGPTRWAEFCAAARERLADLFGPTIVYRRSALIVVGRKP